MAETQPTAERWLPVVGIEDRYLISDHGRVWRVANPPRHDGKPARKLEAKFLGLHDHPAGYKKVSIVRDGKSSYEYVHRLVLEAFVGPCPEGMVACHWDDDPSNNHVSNLRWDTESANQYDKVRNGNHHKARLTHCKFGHEFTPENIKWTKAGNRHCRECARRRNREYEAKLVARYGPKKFWPKGKKSA